MGVEVNLLAVLLAAVAAMVIGGLWYSPGMFGNTWQELARISAKGKAKPYIAIPVAFVASLLTAYVLAHLADIAHNFFGNSFLQDSVSTAFWVWLGLVATRFAIHDSFENRPKMLTFITLAHELIVLMAMGLIIGLFAL